MAVGSATIKLLEGKYASHLIYHLQFWKFKLRVSLWPHSFISQTYKHRKNVLQDVNFSFSPSGFCFFFTFRKINRKKEYILIFYVLVIIFTNEREIVDSESSFQGKKKLRQTNFICEPHFNWFTSKSLLNANIILTFSFFFIFNIDSRLLFHF